MAIVYEVEDEQRGRVALKRPRQPENPEHGRRLYELFAREYQTLSQLAHPRIVQVYDYGHTDDGHFYYVMEYLPGLTLDEVVSADGPLPPARVWVYRKH